MCEPGKLSMPDVFPTVRSRFHPLPHLSRNWYPGDSGLAGGDSADDAIELSIIRLLVRDIRGIPPTYILFQPSDKSDKLDPFFRNYLTE